MFERKELGESDISSGTWVRVAERIDPKDLGKHDGAVNGQEASKAQSGARTLDAAQPVEKFADPLVLMDAPASINWATPASTVLFAGEQLHWSTQGDLHMTAAYALSSVAANAAGYFSQNGGIQAIAANGQVSLQAHTDQLEILADKSIKVISVNDSIEIKASQKIVLQAGQSSITLEGGDITFACPGNFTVKGGQHVFDGGNSLAAGFPGLPDHLQSMLPSFVSDFGPHSLRFAFAGADELVNLVGATNLPFKIADKTGKVLQQGVIGESGRIPRVDLPEPANLTLQLGEEKWEPFINVPALAPPAGAEEDEQLLAAEARSDAPFRVEDDDDDLIHLSKDIITLYVSTTLGEEDS